jgi:hypothetical protein
MASTKDICVKVGLDTKEFVRDMKRAKRLWDSLYRCWWKPWTWGRPLPAKSRISDQTAAVDSNRMFRTRLDATGGMDIPVGTVAYLNPGDHVEAFTPLPRGSVGFVPLITKRDLLLSGHAAIPDGYKLCHTCQCSNIDEARYCRTCGESFPRVPQFATADFTVTALTPERAISEAGVSVNSCHPSLPSFFCQEITATPIGNDVWNVKAKYQAVE